MSYMQGRKDAPACEVWHGASCEAWDEVSDAACGAAWRVDVIGF